MSRYRIVAALCVAAVFFIVGCNFNPQGKVLARVDNEVITLGEFQAKLDRLPPYYRNMAAQQKDKFLDELIDEKLFLKAAYQRGVDKNKEVRDLIEEARKKIIVTKFAEEEMKRGLKVADKEIENYYNVHKKEFVAATRYKASHILVATEEEAKRAMDRLRKGEDFAALAKELSIDPSKSNGGDLGFFTEGQMIPDFESACFKLEPGQTSDIVKTQFGYHIIKLTDKKPSQIRPLNEVSDQIKRKITDMRKSQNLQEIIKELRSKANIKINQELLGKNDK
jgi:peptidyl-prolyl cis-trans isomerase C